MPITQFDHESIKQSIIGKLQRYNGRTIDTATPFQIYTAVAATVRDQIMPKWMHSRERERAEAGKKLYYLSVEFLTGRSLYCNVLNLCATEEYTKAFRELGINWRDIMREEPEPGLGNGGLGRLAACFMDSLASLDMPAMGFTIRYEFGLFRQEISSGQQVEQPDDWLKNGNVWEMPVMDDVYDIRFGGRVTESNENGRMVFRLADADTVKAVPYDMPVVGYEGTHINTLRMWSARCNSTIDLSAFGRGEYTNSMREQELAEVISKVLYPEDYHYEGKQLRLKQHYFFTSATLQYAIADFKRHYGSNYSLIPEKMAIHVNDTHPGFAIPEMMRILIDDEGLGWDEAERITTQTIAYTNHTVMAEALECWPEDMVRQLLPRVYMILEELNRRLCAKLLVYFPKDKPGEEERVTRMAILANGQLRMANLCVAYSHAINGVSSLHTHILCEETFADYYKLNPEKFKSITNGITHRRWLMAANPDLTALICEAIGDAWQKEPQRLEALRPFADDAAFREKFMATRRHNKVLFADMLMGKQKIAIDPDFMFDVQAKRLHEYKRQMLNALHVHVLYNRIMDDPGFTMTPRLFIFGAKASPGYLRAKQIIRYIIALSKLINRSPRASSMLRVVFLENYDVSYAERLMPAADVSEQLSTAGKEASGTGNMKFMMNGAVTIGTMDGANVEISQQVGMDNIYIFGMRADTVADLRRAGTYNPMTIFESNDEIRRAMTQIIDGTLFPDNAATLADLYHGLLFGTGHDASADPYYVLKDYGSYSMAQRRLSADYEDRDKWLRMSVINTAMSGLFSSDRTIREYDDQIWHLKG